MPFIKTLHSKRCNIIVNMVLGSCLGNSQSSSKGLLGPVQACYYFTWIVLSLKGETLNYPHGNRCRKHKVLQYYALGGPQKNSNFISPLIHKISSRPMGDTKAWSEFYQCPLDLLGCRQICSCSARLKCLLFQKCSQYVFMLLFQRWLE